MKPPWWFCCGWWSPWCVIDTFAHEVLRVPVQKRSWASWVCDKHDAAIVREFDRKTTENGV